MWKKLLSLKDIVPLVHNERYKSKERLQWEEDFDCINKMREWILNNALTDEATLDAIEKQAKQDVKDAKNAAWKDYLQPIKDEVNEAVSLMEQVSADMGGNEEIASSANELKQSKDPIRKDVHSAVKATLRISRGSNSEARNNLISWLEVNKIENYNRYSSQLYSETNYNIASVEPVEVQYSDSKVDGREIIRDNFDVLLNKYPELLIFGEDSGKIGGVNQGLEGLQEKHGVHRVFDTGIREATIIGQAIGLAMRGLRPIAEIQYLDYLLYALQIMSDDLATVQWRSKGIQKAPVLIRTRGHRLEGVWHSGSPMGMIVHACRGIHVCVPRDMTRAAGMYNLLMEADEPALVVEPLNGL